MRSTLVAPLLAILTTFPAWGATPAPPESERVVLTKAVAAILRADYRGDRAELRRQIEAVPAEPSASLRAYWQYWQGFAYWRRALNGFNETPAASDAAADLGQAAAAFRAALASDPKFDDARSALLGCLGGQMFVLGPKRPESAAILAEVREIAPRVRETMEGNPRSLWIIGGIQLFAPPPRGDAAKAMATYRQGLAAARREALAAAGREPWVPSWGSPELLMSLAYGHTLAALVDHDVAQAYAEGALSMVPDWHYVADILMPQIEALPQATTGAAATQSPR